MKFLNCDFRTAALEIERVIHGCAMTTTPPRPMPEPDDARMLARVERLWNESAPIQEGDLAWRYLDKRGIIPGHQQIEALRFAPYVTFIENDRFQRLPAMLAAVRDVSGRLVNLHRTLLSHEAEKAAISSPKRLMTSLPEGAAIRLREPGSTLGIAEGIETAMSAEILHGIPCWSSATGSGMKRWLPPPGTRSVIIFADNDENGAGQEAAEILLVRLIARGMDAEIRLPNKTGADWNDVLRGAA
jgi:putative DNA primase/helicase